MVPELQADEKVIAQLFGRQPDSVVWFTPVFDQRDGGRSVTDFKISYCNAAACKILGATPNEVVGSTLHTWKLMDQTSTRLIWEQCLKVWTTDEPIEFTFHSPGLDKHLNVQRSKVMNGILSITRDRTREVKIEKERDEQAQLLSLMLNSSLNGMYTLEAIRTPHGAITDFRIMHVNDIFCQMSARKKEDLVGKIFSEVFPDTRKSGLFERNSRVLETGEPLKQEIHYVGDGVDRWYQNSINKIGNDLIVIAFHDITPLKHATVQLERSIRELRSSNEKLSDFTHIASHDLREPLRKISTYSNLVIEKYNGTLDKDVGEYLGKINKTAIRMQTLISDLLTFSEVSNSSNEFRPLSLSAILQDVQHDLEAVIHEKKAKIVFDALPEIRGDKMQITQVFQNLISNALKFQKGQAVPFIEVKREADGQRDGVKYLCISVRDNGIGFDQSHADKIFRIFHRLHSRAEFGGSGIGLAIVQKAMHNHSGYLEVTSQPGKGTSFYLFFPTE